MANIHAQWSSTQQPTPLRVGAFLVSCVSDVPTIPGLFMGLFEGIRVDKPFGKIIERLGEHALLQWVGCLL